MRVLARASSWGGTMPMLSSAQSQLVHLCRRLDFEQNGHVDEVAMDIGNTVGGFYGTVLCICYSIFFRARI